MATNDDLLKSVRNMREIVENQMLPALINDPSREDIDAFWKMSQTCITTAEKAAELYERNLLVAKTESSAEEMYEEVLEHLEFFERIEANLELSSWSGKYLG